MDVLKKSLWVKYHNKLLNKLRTDETFLQGMYGKPTSLPEGFKSERLIIEYINNKLLPYEKIKKGLSIPLPLTLPVQDGGARSVEELWEIYGEKLKEKLSKDASFVKLYNLGLLMKDSTQSSQPKEAAAITIDTLPLEFSSAEGGLTYAEWIIRSYLKNCILNFSDIVDDVYDALIKFNILKNKKSLKFNKDINSYCGLNDEKGLNFVLKKYGPFYEDDTIEIYIPSTEEEACSYGRKTSWCTASKKESAFDNYNQMGPLYIFIPKNPDHPGEKYQFHAETDSYMDENDEQVDLYKFMMRYRNLGFAIEKENFYRLKLKYPENSTAEILVPKNATKTRANENYKITTNEENHVYLVNDMNEAMDILEFTVTHPDVFDIIYEDAEITLYAVLYNETVQVLIPKIIKPGRSFPPSRRQAEMRYLLNYNSQIYTQVDGMSASFDEIYKDYPSFLDLITKDKKLRVYSPKQTEDANINIHIFMEKGSDAIFVNYRKDIFQTRLVELLQRFPHILNLYKKVFENIKVKVYSNEYQTFIEQQTNLLMGTDEKILIFDRDARKTHRSYERPKITIEQVLQVYPEIANVTDVLNEEFNALVSL